MTTLVYQNGKLYADTKLTRVLKNPGLSFEEAYQASLARAPEAISLGYSKEEYKKAIDLTFFHRWYDRNELTIIPKSKIVEIDSDIDTQGRGKVLAYAISGTVAVIPWVDDVFGRCATLKEAFEELNDFFHSCVNAAGGDGVNTHFILLVKTDRGCFYFRPSLHQYPAVGFMSKYNTKSYYAVGTGPVAHFHGGDVEKFFNRSSNEAELDRYDGQIEDINLFYAQCAAVDPMTNTVIDVH